MRDVILSQEVIELTVVLRQKARVTLTQGEEIGLMTRVIILKTVLYIFILTSIYKGGWLDCRHRSELTQIYESIVEA